MPTLAFIILNEEERVAAKDLSTPSAVVDPRQIDNPLSNFLGYGTLVGKYVLNASILNNPAYTAWFDMLTALPIHVMDSETLFNPSPEI